MTADEHDDVRRLLADLGERDLADPPPIPPEVAARLDRALGELGEERPVAGDVVPLRRRARPLVAAAAAVVVVLGGGVAVTSTLLGGGDGTGSESTAGGATSTDQGEDSASPQETPEQDGSQDGGQDGSEEQLRTFGAPAIELTSTDLSEEVEGLLSAGQVVTDPSGAERRSQETEVRAQGCEPPTDPGAVVLVQLDGEPATLLVGEVTAGQGGEVREASVVACDGDGELAATQVPETAGGR